MTLLLAATAKASLLLAVALGASRLARTAAVRHALLAAALGSAGAMPLLSLVLPHWGLASLLTPVTDLASSSGVGALMPWLAAVWVAGMAACAGVLAARLVRLSSVGARRPEIVEGPLADLALHITTEYRLPRPVTLLQGDMAPLLGTWGVDPKVIVPEQAHGWPRATQVAVLRHEFAHVRRRDWIVQTAAEGLRAIYWFNPLFWIACRELRTWSEHACDAAVIGSGIDRREYAASLIDVARTIRQLHDSWAVASMAQPSTLERRVRAILQPRPDAARPARRMPAVAVAATLAATLLLAAIGRPDAPETIIVPNPRAQTLTLLLDGRIVDLSQGMPASPDPNAGLVPGRGFALAASTNR